jgi:hypothetical protein
MTDNMALALATTSIIGALFSLVCRIGRMHKGVTRSKVFLQHLALAAGLVIALVVPPKLAMLSIALGVHVFLGLGAARWRHGAPDDTKESTWISN